MIATGYSIMMAWLSWIKAHKENVIVLERDCIGSLANLDLS